MSASDHHSSGWKAWLSHAFAVEKAEHLKPTEMQREIVDRLSREVVRRRLTAPVLLALEMSRPLNMLSAAAMHMLQPIISAVMSTHAYEQFALFLEHRGSIDYICRRIEHFEKEAAASADPPTQPEEASAPANE